MKEISRPATSHISFSWLSWSRQTLDVLLCPPSGHLYSLFCTSCTLSTVLAFVSHSLCGQAVGFLLLSVNCRLMKCHTTDHDYIVPRMPLCGMHYTVFCNLLSRVTVVYSRKGSEAADERRLIKAFSQQLNQCVSTRVRQRQINK